MLQITNLICGYNGKEIIKGISFVVKPGEVLGVIGPNGAGKTTLFRAISRVIRPWNGKITYNERDILEIPIKLLAREIAVLPQLLQLGFPFQVKDFIAMGRMPHLGRWESLKRKDQTIIDEAIQLANVKELENRFITEISGGELQRVFLAQALTQQPKVLLLDEPMAHLDIGHQIEVMDLVKKLNREQKLTIIMVLHDLNMAGEYCDRLILLNQGQIHSSGVPAEVLTYQNIETVYQTVVVVKENPMSGKPYIFLVPKDKWQKGK